MNCCDEFGNCKQGRECPLRKEKTPCTRCFGTGYDASGQLCACQPDRPEDSRVVIIVAIITIMLTLLAITSCTK